MFHGQLTAEQILLGFERGQTLVDEVNKAAIARATIAKHAEDYDSLVRWCVHAYPPQ